MKVLLTTNVKTLGTAGEIVNVSDGYARNYLFPRNLAVVAGAAAEKMAEQVKKHQRTHEASLQAKAREMAARLRGVSCTVKAPADESGRLYGSIAEKEIVAALAAAGVQVDRRQIHLDVHIKAAGDYTIPVRVVDEQFENITLQVVADRPC
jgi:large subunit ribosomal protein L9